jgi:hypothetical protein
MGKVAGVLQRREARWRETITRQEGSGLSVAAFCRKERINAWTLYGWRSRLRGVRDKTVSEPLPVRAPSGGFIDLGALREGDAGWEIRLELGGGVVLQLRRV